MHVLHDQAALYVVQQGVASSSSVYTLLFVLFCDRLQSGTLSLSKDCHARSLGVTEALLVSRSEGGGATSKAVALLGSAQVTVVSGHVRVQCIGTLAIVQRGSSSCFYLMGEGWSTSNDMI
jgi:hypothetical protein